MKKKFIHEDFLLETRRARQLYHEHAAGMPIIDYHCHLSPQDIAEDRRWENIARVWLAGDHYKWRAMRSNGIEERFCTGDAPDREKFDAFAATMPYLLRNPMFDWSHLELARYFGIDDLLLGPGTAEEIWTRTAQRLSDPDFSARGLMRSSGVRLVCTTDDPCDSLEYHLALAGDSDVPAKVLPTWRPDKVLALDRVDFFNEWVDRLGRAAERRIDDFDDLLKALQKRHDFFHAVGCRISDYGVTTIPEETGDRETLAGIFARVRSGESPSAGEVRRFRSGMLYECGRMDAAADWTWQIHYGALRNNNSRMFERLGPDTGFDSIGDWPVAEGMARLFDRLDRDNALPRTLVYTLNPRDNELVAAMLGNFQQGPTPGKLQFGSGWWFNDQRDGMLRQMEALSQLGLLGRFVGMLTDSRSFLSYTRHEYFRRILCNLLGRDMELGRIPDDPEWIGSMVRDISYNNARNYFGIDLPEA